MQLLTLQTLLQGLDYIRRDMEDELVEFLADPDNVQKFIGMALTKTLGFELTEEGQWVKLDS